MDDFCRYAGRPFAFVFRYIRLRPGSHLLVLTAVVAAVACSVSTQYGVKYLVDTLSGTGIGSNVWFAFLLLVSLIAADNLLWRLASWVANFTFVGVTGDLRRDLFRHLTGHSPSYFTDRLPGMLTSRVSATSNAVYTIENMSMWNVLPPCAATIAAIGFVQTISAEMAASLALVGGVTVTTMVHLAAAGRSLHHDFADKTAAVDGEMVDVVSNMQLVRAFCGLSREHRRFDATIDREMTARRRSLLYLEKLRILHALVTIVLTLGLLAWAIALWQRGLATTGDVVLACTLGMSVLHATRDLAVALVDVTQHVARLSEALATLLVPHELRDHPEAEALIKRGASLEFTNVTFRYADGNRVFERLNLRLEPGQRVGLVGQSGGGKSTLFALLQRFYDLENGRILIDGQDIARVTQESLRDAIAVVPQDISLFHRSVIENIRNGRPGCNGPGGARRRDRGTMRGLHCGLAKRPRNHCGRARREAVRRPAPTHCDCPRILERCAASSAGRGHVRIGWRFRGSHSGSAGSPDERSNRDCDRTSAVDRTPFRPGHRIAGRTGGTGRSARPLAAA